MSKDFNAFVFESPWQMGMINIARQYSIFSCHVMEMVKNDRKLWYFHLFFNIYMHFWLIRTYR